MPSAGEDETNAFRSDRTGIGGAVAAALLSACCNSSPPLLTVEPQTLQFASLIIGQTTTQMVTVTNASHGAMRVEICGSSAPCSAPDFELPTAPLDLPAGQSQQVPITFAPRYLGNAIHEVAGFAGMEESCSVNCNVLGIVEVQLLGTSTSTESCTPPPGLGFNNQEDIGGTALSDFVAQGSFTCGSVTLFDGGSRPVGDGGLGDACQSALDCPGTCCACPRDCASFGAGACILGTCAPSSMSCLVGQLQVPAVCPDGGSNPSEVNGSRPFAVTAAAASLSADAGITVRLHGAAGASGCGGSDEGPELVLEFPSQGLSVLPAGQVYSSSIKATFTPLDGGSIAATDGRVFLAPIEGSLVAGAFDVAFPPDDELWGSFSAAVCP